MKDSEKTTIRCCQDCGVPLDNFSKEILETRQEIEYVISHGLCEYDYRVRICEAECKEKLESMSHAIKQMIIDNGALNEDEMENIDIISKRISAVLLYPYKE